MIDLVFLSNLSSLISCDILPPLATSDHHAVQVALKLKTSPRDTKPPTKKIWLYSKADLTLAKQLLKQLPIVSTGDNIDVFWRKWLTVFMDAMNCSIPSKSIPINSATPWINRDIRTDIAKRERMFRKAKRSNSQDHLSRYFIAFQKTLPHLYLLFLISPSELAESHWTGNFPMSCQSQRSLLVTACNHFGQSPYCLS